MGDILIFFCFVSACISIILVVIETSINIFRQFFTYNLNDFSYPKLLQKIICFISKIKFINLTQIDQTILLRYKIENSLKKQLSKIGYKNTKQQNYYIQSLFQKPKANISSLEPYELRILLKKILYNKKN